MAEQEELSGRISSFRVVSRRSDFKRHVGEAVFNLSVELGVKGEILSSFVEKEKHVCRRGLENGPPSACKEAAVFPSGQSYSDSILCRFRLLL